MKSPPPGDTLGRRVAVLDTNRLHAPGFMALAVAKYAFPRADHHVRFRHAWRLGDMSKLAWPGQLTQSHTLGPNQELAWH